LGSLLARLLLVVSVALIPAVGFQVYAEIQARAVRDQLVKTEALRLVRIVSADQQRIAESAEQVMRVIAGSPVVQENAAQQASGQPRIGNQTATQSCAALLAAVLNDQPRYAAAAVIGVDGHPICRPPPLDRDEDMSDRDYFRLALQAGSFVIAPYSVGKRSKTEGIHFAMPFRNAARGIAGVVVLDLRIDWLQQQLAQLELPPGSSTVITDRNGTILAHLPVKSGAASLTGQKLPPDELALLNPSDTSFNDVTGADGRALVQVFAASGVAPASLFIGLRLDRAASFGLVSQADRTGLTLIVAGGVLALLLTALLGSRLIRQPVDRLVQVAQRWQDGDLSARSGVAGQRGEFGKLAAAFEAMASALDRRTTALTTALESTTDSVVVLDRDWRFSFINGRAETLLGTSRGLLGKLLWDVVPELLGTPAEAAFRRAASSGVSAASEFRDPASGRELECHAYPSAEGLTIFLKDITQERGMAAALQQSEALFRATFEQAAVGMSVGLPDGSLTLVNDRFSDITGTSAKDLVHGGLAAITHPDDAEICAALPETLFAGDPGHDDHPTANATLRLLRRDGSIVWVDVFMSLLRDADGQPSRIFSVIEDITERKHAEAALQDSETHLQMAREGAHIGLWDEDLVDGKVFWSEEQWRLHGLEPQSQGLPYELWIACVHPDDRARVSAERAEHLARLDASYDHEYRVLLPNSRIRWLQNKGKVFRDADGAALRIVGMTMDITAGRETEAALRRLSTELEGRVREEVAARQAAQERAAHAERMQALGQLAAGIAHDFNNVLQAVMGAATLIERRPDDTAGVRRLARMAAEAVKRGSAVTRRLLTFGRRGDLRTEALDVAELLTGVQEILEHTLGAAIEVRVQVGGVVRPMAADPRQLETVLVNLATNARDAMPNGGVLTLGAQAEAVGLADLPHPAGLGVGRYVRLTVTDTGVGMDAVTLARSVQPFFSTKPHGAGTGLGLPMAKSLAEQSGGSFRIESRPGEGTHVTIWLPEAKRQTDRVAPRETPPLVRAPIYRSGPILVVDDEELIRETIATQLEDAGYGVLVAANGAEALALLETEPAIDALVTDLSMPGISGLELIRTAQARHAGLAAVLLTGYAAEEANLTGGGMSGTFSMLRKPFREAEILDQLGAALASRSRRLKDRLSGSEV
jgi:PAS domain S-box-containing protein